MGEQKREEMNGEDEFENWTAGSSGGGDDGGEGGSSGGGLAERLRTIMMEEREDDLVMREGGLMRWLQALDFQVMGACRADERLKPLLKINSSSPSGATEDRLLAHLSQHFEASEVGMLARCLCVPLVTMRVGKVVKQGSLLCPTSSRGTLSLTLLPSSDLRLSFVGDNGQTERLATLSDSSGCSDVAVEEIPADQSGRSFLVKLPGGETFYFWCSEKSKLLGTDLLYKMKNLLERKPSLPELTGISESRLECFATHLRAYLVGPSASNIQASNTAASAPWPDISPSKMEAGHSSSASMKPLRSRPSSGQTLKGHPPFQGSLSPRPGLFKEGLPRSLSSLRSTSREKLKRRGDHLSPVDNSLVAEAVLNLSEKGTHSESTVGNSASPLSFLESLGNCSLPFSPSTTPQLPTIGSIFSPYYCWCPPSSSPSVAPVANHPSFLTEPFSLPPLSTLLPGTATPSLFTPMPPLDVTGLPPLEFPALLSDPLARLPFTRQSAQQIPTFTPLMCDPIIHIPVVDVCSLGQGYLVSAGPAIATSISSLHPKLVGPMMSEGESMLEKGARETLRLLIASSNGQPSSSLMGVLPAVLTNEDNQGVIVTGSRGLYSGISDVDAMVNSFAAVGLTSVCERSMADSSLKSYSHNGALDTVSQTSTSLDLLPSAYMSREEKKD